MDTQAIGTANDSTVLFFLFNNSAAEQVVVASRVGENYSS